MRNVLSRVMLTVSLCAFAFGIAARAGADTEVHMFNDVNLAIPSASDVGVTDTRAITSAITNITDVNVWLKIGPQYTTPAATGYNGDIYAALTHNGRKAILLNRVGRRGYTSSTLGYADDGYDVTFSDTGVDGDFHAYRVRLTGSHDTALGSGVQATGEFEPDAREDNISAANLEDPRAAFLSRFSGMDANGDWVVTAYDRFAGDTHTLQDFDLILTDVGGATETIQNSALGLAIPDNDATGTTHTTSVTGSAVTNIATVKIRINVTGTWNGDTCITVSHGGQTVVLVNRPGRRTGGASGSSTTGYSDDGFDVTLDDAATDGDIHAYRLVVTGSHTTAMAANTPVTGDWAPDGRDVSPVSVILEDPRTALLDVFNGDSANGDWTLEIADRAASNGHALYKWSLLVTDTNSVETEYQYPGPEIVIPNNDATGITNVINVAGGAANITKVRVKLTILPYSVPTPSSMWNGDLYAYLEHSTGRTVLLNRVGRTSVSTVGYSDDGFDVKLDDAAANGDIHLYRTVTGTLPTGTRLTGDWAPDGRDVDPTLVVDTDPRDALLDKMNGLDANGEWKLFLADRAAGDLHTLESWGLEITGDAGVVGDVDGNGCVDDADLTAVILDYGAPESGNNGNTDVDNSGGDVDDADITIVILKFGNGC